MKKSELRQMIKEEILKEYESSTDLTEKFKSIDWAPLEAQLSKFIGININITKKDLYNNKYIHATSENLISKTGIFKSLLKTAIIEGTSNSLNTDSNVWEGNWILKFVPKFTADVQVANSYQLFRTYYDFNSKKWTFKLWG